MNFKIICADRNNYEIPYTCKIFAGGEVQVRLGKLPVGNYLGIIVIDGLVKNSNMLMELLLIANALRATSACEEILAYIHYLPYARQDRVCHPGEAFSLKSFIPILTNSSLDKILVDDVHSDVAINLTTYPYPNNKWVFIPQWTLLLEYIPSFSTYIISPDKGAEEKVKRLADYSNNKLIVYNKRRNLGTGNIECTEFVSGDQELYGKDCLIVDDICDGGRTFVPIIKDLLNRGAGRVNLCVTHAILPYGLDALMEAGLNAFFYVNSFLEEELPNMYHISEFKEVIKGA